MRIRLVIAALAVLLVFGLYLCLLGPAVHAPAAEADGAHETTVSAEDTSVAGMSLAAPAAPPVSHEALVEEPLSSVPEEIAVASELLHAPADGSATSPQHAPPLRFPEADEEQYTIEGHVMTPEGLGIPHLSVSVMLSGYAMGSRTDEGGHFLIHNIRPGQVRVVAQLGPGREVEATVQVVKDTYVLLRAPTLNVVRGQVFDAETGLPLERFQVGAVEHYHEYPTSWMKGQMATYSDPEGRYELRTGLEGLRMVAAATGYRIEMSEVIAVAPDEPAWVEMVLERSPLVTGEVVDSAGNPVPNARIVVATSHPDFAEESPASTFSDANGAFVLDSLAESERDVFAFHDDFGRGRAAIPPEGGSVRIVMTRGGRIVGQITMGREPVTENVYIATGYVGHRVGNVGPDGRYELTEVMPGELMVYAVLSSQPPNTRDPEARFMSQAVQVSDGETAEANFDFPRADASLQGTVYVGDQPAQEGSVSAIVFTDEGDQEINCDIAGNGRYVLAGFPGASLRLHIAVNVSPDVVLEKNLWTEVRSGQQATLDVVFGAVGTLTGYVEGVRGGAYAAALFPGDLHIPDTITRAELDSYHPYTIIGRRVGNDGTFVFDSVEAGTYLLHLSPMGYFGTGGDVPIPCAQAPVTVEPGQTAEVYLTVQTPEEAP
jgi:hypothetical protein